MKKIIIALLLVNLFLPAYSFEGFKKSPEGEVCAVMNKHTKAMSNHDVQAVKSFYAANYKSSDGFTLDELGKMLEKTYSAYNNIKYKTKISAINAYDDWALVQMSDKSSAVVLPEDKSTNKKKMGKLEGKSVYNVYLKKMNNEWKIVSEDILLEETTLKFGIARKIDMDILSPLVVKAGQEYDLSLKINKPKDILALASISREEIVYPPVDSPEKYRRIPQDGELERLVRANDKNLDE